MTLLQHAGRLRRVFMLEISERQIEAGLLTSGPDDSCQTRRGREF